MAPKWTTSIFVRNTILYCTVPVKIHSRQPHNIDHFHSIMQRLCHKTFCCFCEYRKIDSLSQVSAQHGYSTTVPFRRVASVRVTWVTIPLRAAVGPLRRGPVSITRVPPLWGRVPITIAVWWWRPFTLAVSIAIIITCWTVRSTTIWWVIAVPPVAVIRRLSFRGRAPALRRWSPWRWTSPHASAWWRGQVPRAPRPSIWGWATIASSSWCSPASHWGRAHESPTITPPSPTHWWRASFFITSIFQGEWVAKQLLKSISQCQLLSHGLQLMCSETSASSWILKDARCMHIKPIPKCREPSFHWPANSVYRLFLQYWVMKLSDRNACPMKSAEFYSDSHKLFWALHEICTHVKSEKCT